MQKLLGGLTPAVQPIHSIVNVNISIVKHTLRTSDNSIPEMVIYTHHSACRLSGGLTVIRIHYKVMFRFSWKPLDPIILDRYIYRYCLTTHQHKKAISVSLIKYVACIGPGRVMGGSMYGLVTGALIL